MALGVAMVVAVALQQHMISLQHRIPCNSDQVTHPKQHTIESASTSDDCCEVCLVAPPAGFTLLPCGHARFCDSYAMNVSHMAAGYDLMSCVYYHVNAPFLLDDRLPNNDGTITR